MSQGKAWRWSQADIAKMMGLRLKGLTLAQIGERYGVSRQRMQVILSEATAKSPRCTECTQRPSRIGSELCGFCADLVSGKRRLARRTAGMFEARRRYPHDISAQARIVMPKSVIAPRVVRLRRRGLSLRKIAQAVGTSPGYVGQLLARLRNIGLDI